jgi:hypothetical protein
MSDKSVKDLRVHLTNSATLLFSENDDYVVTISYAEPDRQCTHDIVHMT